jgi:hypothetical protein
VIAPALPARRDSLLGDEHLERLPETERLAPIDVRQVDVVETLGVHLRGFG